MGGEVEGLAEVADLAVDSAVSIGECDVVSALEGADYNSVFAAVVDACAAFYVVGFIENERLHFFDTFRVFSLVLF